MSPRRSSRARITQSVPSAPKHTNSSTSSISSGRAERSTRSHNKITSPRTSIPRSQSNDHDEPSKPQPRRTRSGHEEPKEPVKDIIEDEDDLESEEGVTRCICGNTEYPGLPDATARALRLPNAGDGVDVLPEENGGLFIQCDVCKVWQHGGCVGILDAASSPDEYFCEECRKDLHKITITAEGQKYSLYLPVQQEISPPTSRETSLPESSSRKKDSKMTRPSAEALAHKRRATMNSRDAAYDEAEQLRRAIEESKKELGGSGGDEKPRRNKRSRSDSPDPKDGVKRQRTASDSSRSSEKPLQASDSGDEALAIRKPKDTSHKARGTTSRQEKDLQEREEERQKERAAAAEKRKGRADRRRAEDSDPSEEALSRTTSAKGHPNTSHPTDISHPSPDTPITNPDPPAPKPSHKKSGRPPAKRGRVGRNQYTRDRDHLDTGGGGGGRNGHSRTGSLLEPIDGSNIASEPISRRRSRSRSVMAEHREYHPSMNGTGNINGNNGHATGGNWGESGFRPSKPKHMNPNRTSMSEMKKRVARILEFVSRTQIEMAVANGQHGHNGSSRAPSHGSPKDPIQTPTNGAVEAVGEGAGASMVEGESAETGGGHVLFPPTGGGLLEVATYTKVEMVEEVDFKLLSSADMMRVLAGKLEGWQREYGRWGEK